MIDKRRYLDKINERRNLNKMCVIAVNRRQLIIDGDVFLIDERRDLDEIDERRNLDKIDIIVVNRRQLTFR